MKGEFNIQDEWLPFEIHPETPLKGRLITDLFPASSFEGMYKNLRKMGSQYGIEFNTLTILSNTRLSLAAGEYAKEKGRFHEYHEHIFRAYFTENKDIGDINVILDIAKSLGMDREELKAKLENKEYDGILEQVAESAHSNNISSTPTFIIDDKYTLVGAQPLESFREAILKIEKQS